MTPDEKSSILLHMLGIALELARLLRPVPDQTVTTLRRRHGGLRRLVGVLGMATVGGFLACAGAQPTSPARVSEAVTPPSEALAVPATSEPSTGSQGGATASASAATASPSGSALPAEVALSPIASALPETKNTRPLAHRGACPETPTACVQRIIVPDGARPEAADPAPIYVWEQDIPRRSMLYLPKHAGLELYGVMIDGEVSVLADDIPGKDKQKRMWRMDAIRAPGVGVNVYAKEPTRIVFALVSPTGEPISKALAGLPARDVSWKKRSAPITSLEFEHRPPTTWGGGAFHARYGFEADGDAPAASLTLLLASKDAPIAENVHDKEWEALVILQGEGDMMLKGARRRLEPGSIWAVPPGTPHGFRPAGTSPMFAIQFFVGPGPEQRYKQLARP